MPTILGIFSPANGILVGGVMGSHKVVWGLGGYDSNSQMTLNEVV